MIDENKLIREIEDWKEKVGKTFEGEVIETVLDMVLSRIKGQPKVGEWIPCNERLPENDRNVRVTCVNGCGELELGYGWYNHHTDRWEVCTDTDNVMYHARNVTAWKDNTDKPYELEKKNWQESMMNRFVRGE